VATHRDTAESAAEIEYAQALQWRQQAAQYRPLGRACKTFDGSSKLTVPLEEVVLIVNVLRHASDKHLPD